ncbi:TIGR01244 family sulfur transferase [Rhizobium sp. SL42]|uniref:TIGR01244 family sulfur transferase n=1 Tax=Rhizobium sp. SL42 TaxID=2806346 RepID=UPI001F2D00FB|nr:TIGR01244 family sulfur transferase [Rhizobium sp. SL42]UJW76993.1 TIGR01244 family phosphatase [Rhizobium sp. SL42]
MSIRTIDRNFHVTGQIKPAAMQDIAALGYKTVICMRPDKEGFFQPTFADMEAAAEAAGIKAHYIPVVPGAITPANLAALKSVLGTTSGPVLAYCASGNRCASAFEMSKQG